MVKHVQQVEFSNLLIIHKENTKETKPKPNPNPNPIQTLTGLGSGFANFCFEFFQEI